MCKTFEQGILGNFKKIGNKYEANILFMYINLYFFYLLFTIIFLTIF